MMTFRAAAGVCIGNAHIQEGLPCQDVAVIGKWPDGCAAVLADGAGSCRHARDGAETVTKTILTLLEANGTRWMEAPAPVIWDELIVPCLHALAESPFPLEEQACTLLFTLVNKDGCFLCGHIGDGYIFRVGTEAAELLSDAENGDHLYETVFVTTPDARAHLRLSRGVLADGEGLLLCSDGAGEALFDRAARRSAAAVSEITGWLRRYAEADVSAALERNMDRYLREITEDDMSIAALCIMEETVNDPAAEE